MLAGAQWWVRQTWPLLSCLQPQIVKMAPEAVTYAHLPWNMRAKVGIIPRPDSCMSPVLSIGEGWNPERPPGKAELLPPLSQPALSQNRQEEKAKAEGVRPGLALFVPPPTLSGLPQVHVHLFWGVMSQFAHSGPQSCVLQLCLKTSSYFLPCF